MNKFRNWKLNCRIKFMLNDMFKSFRISRFSAEFSYAWNCILLLHSTKRKFDIQFITIKSVFERHGVNWFLFYASLGIQEIHWTTHKPKIETHIYTHFITIKCALWKIDTVNENLLEFNSFMSAYNKSYISTYKIFTLFLIPRL